MSLLKSQNAVIVQSESSILESCVRSYCLIAAIMFDFLEVHHLSKPTSLEQHFVDVFVLFAMDL